MEEKKELRADQLLDIAKGLPRKKKREFCKKFKIPFFLVSTSKAENDELIKRRQPNTQVYKVVGSVDSNEKK